MFDAVKNAMARFGGSARPDGPQVTEASKDTPLDEKAELPPAGAVARSRTSSFSSGTLTVGDELLGSSEVDPVYFAKAHLLSQAYAEIGMGKYQVCYQSLALAYIELIVILLVGFIRGCGIWLVLR